MTMKHFHTNTFTDEDDLLSFISTSMQTMGWVLYDDVSSTKKILTSTGEDDIFVDVYVEITSSISTHKISFDAYLWWDNSTHVGTCKSYSYTSYNYNLIESGRSFFLCGDKDGVILWNATSNTTTKCNTFGFAIPYIPGYTIASGISSGSNIIVDVDSTVDFIEGANIMIVGSSTEGRDKVELKKINSETQIELTSTPRAYASGAKIGHYPCTFYTSFGRANIDFQYLHYLCDSSNSSTTGGTINDRYLLDSKLHYTNTYLDPEDYLNKHIIQPFTLRLYSSPYSIIGYVQHLKSAPILAEASTYYDTDLYCVGDMAFSGTPTSTTSSGIIDIGHSWTNDEFKDKIIVVTSGPGLGQTRKVLSNSNDTLSIGDLWDTSPDNNSTYELYTSVYRHISSYFAIKEIID